MTALAIDTDIMGSARIAASYCGVFAIRPSPGMVSNKGSRRSRRLMDRISPIARSARDLELALGVMCGFDIEDSESVKYQTVAYPTLPEVPVLLVPDDLSALTEDDSIIADFKRNLQIFIDLGCEVKPVDMSDYDFAEGRRAGLLISDVELGALYRQEWQQSPERFSAQQVSFLTAADKNTAADIILAEKQSSLAVISARKLFAQGHYLLMPTTGQRAEAFDAALPERQADLCCYVDQAGLTAVSIPMISDSELPAGMQVIGQAGSDFEILKLAQAWQEASGFEFEMPSFIQNLCAQPQVVQESLVN